MSSGVAATAQPSGEVTAEDQRRINRFARLHDAFVSAKTQIRQLENTISNHSEAMDELLLLDDDDAQQDEVTARLEKLKAEAEGKLEELRAAQTERDGEMRELKRLLYAKFGDNINLEADPDD